MKRERPCLSQVSYHGVNNKLDWPQVIALSVNPGECVIHSVQFCSMPLNLSPFIVHLIAPIKNDNSLNKFNADIFFDASNF